MISHFLFLSSKHADYNILKKNFPLQTDPGYYLSMSNPCETLFRFPPPTPPTMSSVLSSQGVVLATAMAVSGTVILLAFCRQKALAPPQTFPRSCISSDEKKKERKKKKKRVHFAEDVVDPSGDSEEFRRQHSGNSSFSVKRSSEGVKGMPANRVALYNGLLRERVVHRLAYSY